MIAARAFAGEYSPWMHAHHNENHIETFRILLIVDFYFYNSIWIEFYCFNFEIVVYTIHNRG